MEESIQVSDRKFKKYLSQENILAEVDRVAAQINHDLAGTDPLFLCVLNGAFVFAADLFRRINIQNAEITFVRMKSYDGLSTTGTVRALSNIPENVAGRTIVIVEDIVDSGFTLDRMVRWLQELGAADVRVAVLLNKPRARKVESLKIDYSCMEIPNDFIVGYGLDYNEMGRNLPDIYVVTE